MRSGQESVLPHTLGCLPYMRGVTELPNSILHQVLCRADLCAGTVPMSGDDVYRISVRHGALGNTRFGRERRCRSTVDLQQRGSVSKNNAQYLCIVC